MAKLPAELHYRAVKLFLDMATSLLVFLDAYEPTYAGRAQRLRQMAESAEVSLPLPFDLKPFAERVSTCTQWKLFAGKADAASSAELCREALAYASWLWPWELAQLATLSPEASPEDLFAGVAARQSAGQKLRGWLYVVRRMGWGRSALRWPRWLTMAFRCSPRYSIYEAAWRLVSDRGTADQIRSLLPVSQAPGPQERDSRSQLVGALGWNYRTFLTETRA